MILGIGTDIIEVERIRRAAEKEGFLQRLFTGTECEHFAAANNDPQRIAGAFAAKEAVSKALGTGIGAVDWKDIEVIHDDRGRPLTILTGTAKEKMEELGGTKMHISISHIKELAVAQAILEGMDT